MKRIMQFLMVAVLLTTLTSTTKAQTTNTFVSGGVSVSNAALYENVELGQTFGKNSLSLNVSTTDDVSYHRQWFGGVKYYRTVVTVSSSFDISASGAVLINLTDRAYLTFKPAVNLNFKLANNVYIQGSLGSPISENSRLFSPTRLEAGAQLVIRI